MHLFVFFLTNSWDHLWPLLKNKKSIIISLHKSVRKMPKFPILLTYERENSADFTACLPVMISHPTGLFTHVCSCPPRQACPLLLWMCSFHVQTCALLVRHICSWLNHGSSCVWTQESAPLQLRLWTSCGLVSADSQDGSVPSEQRPHSVFSPFLRTKIPTRSGSHELCVSHKKRKVTFTWITNLSFQVALYVIARCSLKK